MLKSGRPSCSRSGWGSDIGPSECTSGIGLPATTRFRRYQNPPPRNAGTNHQPAATQRRPGPASTTTASVSAAAIANPVTRVPAASPAASPAAARAHPSIRLFLIVTWDQEGTDEDQA